MVVLLDALKDEDNYNSSFKVSVRVFCDDTNEDVVNANYTLNSTQKKLSVPIKEGNTYKIYFTPKTPGTSHLSAVVYGE